MSNIHNSDWSSFEELWNDIVKFISEHPKHRLFPADCPPKFGWMVFIPGVEDDQFKQWTIHINDMKTDTLPNSIKRALKTARGRINMCNKLTKNRISKR